MQFVCCKLTTLQMRLYDMILNSKEMRHIRDGKQTNTLNSIRHLINVCSHPLLVLESYRTRFDRAAGRGEEPSPDDDDDGGGGGGKGGKKGGKGGAKKAAVAGGASAGAGDEELEAMAVLVESHCRPSTGGGGGGSAFGRLGGAFNTIRASGRQLAPPPPPHAPSSSSSSSALAAPSSSSGGGGGSSMYATAGACQRSNPVTSSFHVDPEQSGKLLVLYRLMLTLKVPALCLTPHASCWIGPRLSLDRT